jgi:hypothetical protein
MEQEPNFLESATFANTENGNEDETATTQENLYNFVQGSDGGDAVKHSIRNLMLAAALAAEAQVRRAPELE